MLTSVRSCFQVTFSLEVRVEILTFGAPNTTFSQGKCCKKTTCRRIRCYAFRFIFCFFLEASGAVVLIFAALGTGLKIGVFSVV